MKGTCFVRSEFHIFYYLYSCLISREMYYIRVSIYEIFTSKEG